MGSRRSTDCTKGPLPWVVRSSWRNCAESQARDFGGKIFMKSGSWSLRDTAPNINQTSKIWKNYHGAQGPHLPELTPSSFNPEYSGVAIYIPLLFHSHSTFTPLYSGVKSRRLEWVLGDVALVPHDKKTTATAHSQKIVRDRGYYVLGRANGVILKVMTSLLTSSGRVTSSVVASPRVRGCGAKLRGVCPRSWKTRQILCLGSRSWMQIAPFIPHIIIITFANYWIFEK